MDAEHRHELKENDLAEFLANIGPWWAKYGNRLLAVVLALAVGLAAIRWVQSDRATAREQAWRDLADTTSPDGYRAVAQSHADPSVQALAYLRGADLLLARASAPRQDQAKTQPAPATDGSTPPAPDETDTSVDLENAALMYQQVLDNAQAHTIFKLNARLGLAAVAENRSDWSQAKRQYDEIIDEAAGGHGAIAHRARTRSAMLDQLKKPVAFRIDPAPTPSPNVPTPSEPDNPADQGNDPDAEEKSSPANP